MSIRVLMLAAAAATAVSAQEYVREWQSPDLGSGAWGGGGGYDVSGDGIPNLWTRGGSRLVIYDKDYNPWWTFDLSGYSYPMLAYPRDTDGDGLITPVDINGDGTGEVVVGAYRTDGSNHYGRFWVYDAVTRRLEWESPELPGFTGHAQLDDVDGDGRHEIIIYRYDYAAGWGYVEVYGYEGSGVAGPGGYRPRTPSISMVPSITRDGAEISCELEFGGFTRVRVFDEMGREVRELLAAELPPGRYLLRWDGRDREGRELPAGVYHFRLESPGQVETGRLVLAR